MKSHHGHRKRVKHYEHLGHVRELTFSCFRRMPLLTNDVWREMLSRSIDAAADRHNWRLTAFVFMPEHVHLLFFPGSALSASATWPQQIFINIDDRGRYTVRNREYSVDALKDLLVQAAANNPASQTVVIRADRRVPWEYVATAMRLCNEAGLRDYSASLADEADTM